MKISYYLKSLLIDLLCLVVVVLVITMFGYILMGCAPVHQLTPAQQSTTRPVTMPLTNINTVIAHTQKSLEGVNILSFIICLAGVGVLAYGIIGADKPLEHLGLVVAGIAGVISLGTLAGEIALPFAPWILLLAFVGGVGYVVFVVMKNFRKPAAPVPPAK